MDGVREHNLLKNQFLHTKFLLSLSFIDLLAVIYVYTKNEVQMNLVFCVVLPGFEPRQTEPKPVVLPLHHRTILCAFC